MEKMTKSFETLVQNTSAGDDVSVVVEVVSPEIDPTLTGKAFVTTRSAEFQKLIVPVIEAIGAAGGEVDVAAWAMDSIYATIPRDQLGELIALDEVRMLDVPEEFTLE